MPELPEVETIARQLNKVLRHGEILDVEVLRQKSFIGEEKRLIGKRIEKISRKAKMLIFDFEKWSEVMVVHLKMTGQLIWRPKDGDGNSGDEVYEGKQVVGGHPTLDWIRELPGKHTRVLVNFRDGSHLFFNDLRVFGWMKLMKKEEFRILESKLPPDVVDKEFTIEYLKSLLKTRKPIKLTIMDSAKLGGAGNIYANDSLFLARIDPRRPSNALNNLEQKRLFNSLKRVIDLGIKYGGASASNYVQVSGIGGKYQEHFLTYKRDGEKCKRCGGVIKKIKLGGRGTFFCPNCQV